MTAPVRVWAGLSERAADGWACVLCARDFATTGRPAVPVGSGEFGGQVFACHGSCADLATTPMPDHGMNPTARKAGIGDE